VPEHTRGQQGPTSKIDLDFLNAAQVTRAEVLEKLKPVDTGFQSDHFFVGRWDTSKWGGWAFLVGYGTSAGGAERFWHKANLLVEFDDSGKVKNHEVFPDKLLLEKLQPVAREAKLSAPEHLDIAILDPNKVPPVVPVSVNLSPEFVEFSQTSKAKHPLQFSVPATSLTGVHSSVFCKAEADPVNVVEALQFDRKIGGAEVWSGAKRICVRMSVPQLITLLRYLSEHESQSRQPATRTSSALPGPGTTPWG